MMAYKLFRLRKNGTLGSLFINRRAVIQHGEWLLCGAYLTKGYAFRPGWHCTDKPHAPHLSTEGRVWCRVFIDDYKEHETMYGLWYIAKRILIPAENYVIEETI